MSAPDETSRPVAPQWMAVVSAAPPRGPARRAAAPSAGPRAAAPPPAADRRPWALDPLRLSLVLLTIVTVSRIHQHYGFLNAVRPGLLLVVLAAGFTLLNPRWISMANIGAHWPGRIVVAFAVAACLSVPFGISSGRAGLFILDDYSKTIVFTLLLIVAMRSVRELRTFVAAFVASAGILVWLSLSVFSLTQSSGSSVARLNNLYTYDANDLGCVLVTALPFVVLLINTTAGKVRWASIAILVGMGATIAKTGSRGAFVGVLVVGAGLLFLQRGTSVTRRLVLAAAAAVALVASAPAGYWKQMSTLTSPTEDYNWDSTNGRRQIALRGVDYMLSYPAFGLGINNFSKAECEISDKVRYHVYGTGIRCAAPHNSYVQAGAELGLPGLGLWLSLVFGGVMAMLRLRGRVPDGWRNGTPDERFLYHLPTCLALALLGFAVTSFFVSFAWLAIVYMLAAYMSGLYVCLSRAGLGVGPAALAGSHRGRSPSPRRA